MVYKLAWRNIWRNKKRTVITLMSIAFAVLLSCVMRSMQLGSYERMIDNTVGNYAGYVQIHKNGYWKDKSIDNSMYLSDSLMEYISTHKMVKGVIPRIESFALASFGSISKGVMVTGIVPNKEHQLSGLDDKLVQGNYLDDEEEMCLLSEGLAVRLKASIGDTVVFIGQGYHGVTAAALFPVKGIVKFPIPDMNDHSVYVPLNAAQWFYGAENLVTSVSIDIDHVDNTMLVANELANMLDREKYEVMDWQTMMPELIQGIELDNVSGLIMLLILYLIIGFGMFGTFLMMTTERTYEFGMMLALGMSRKKIQWMVLNEFLWLTILGLSIGIILSLPIIEYFHLNPIYFQDEAAKAIENFGVEAVYAFSNQSEIYISQGIFVFFLTVILSCYPLFKIAQIHVTKAFRK